MIYDLSLLNTRHVVEITTTASTSVQTNKKSNVTRRDKD